MPIENIFTRNEMLAFSKHGYLFGNSLSFNSSSGPFLKFSIKTYSNKQTTRNIADTDDNFEKYSGEMFFQSGTGPPLYGYSNLTTVGLPH